MAIIKCKMCGGDLEILKDSAIAECEYCGTRQTIPSADNEKKLTLFARANRLRMTGEFDKAAGIYESIVVDFPEEAEAYWGLVLCRYGIEYVDDPGTGKKIPTCHRSAFDSILEDNDFEQACENSDVVGRRLYREEARAIDEIQRRILEISSQEEPYDVFICYKETDENGERTLDSVMAQDVYDVLTEKGYRVFFSRVSLQPGTEYEPYIFAALNSARVMLVFGTDYEYFNAVWVKNEWSRFLALIRAGQKKTLIPCYRNIDAYDMPKEFVKLQGQDMGKIGAIQDLVLGIQKICGVKHLQSEEYNDGELKLDKNSMFAELARKNGGPDIIDRVISIGSNDQNNPWPQGAISSTVSLNDYSVIFFQLFLKKPLGYRGTVTVGFAVYDESGNMLFREETPVDGQADYDRFSKGWILKGGDGSHVQTGAYWAVLWINDSQAVRYKFVVVDNSSRMQDYSLSRQIREIEKVNRDEEKSRRLRKSIDDLEKRQARLQAELKNLTGLFSGKKRKRIEIELAEIEAELRTLQTQYL